MIITKSQLKMLLAYSREFEDLLETLSLDDAAKHYISDTAEDLHFSSRAVLEMLEKKATGLLE